MNPPFSEVQIAVRTLIALVYLTAAIGKMRHWAVFRSVVANYRLLPDVLVAPFAYCLPPFEALLGAALLFGSLSPWAELAAAALLLMFAAAMGINLKRGRQHIDCGCFQSVLKQRLSWTLVVRNGVLTLLLGFALPTTRAAADLRMTMDGLLAGGVLFVILQSLNILWGIVPAWRRPHGLDSGAAL
ncbi:MAG: MauE/DoxX family redox-associated membrane protein [Steroidobacteraceae bacterium]